MGRRNSGIVGRHQLPLDENQNGSPQEDVLTVNREFARRFAHNSKRTALHRLQELKKRGVVDSSDESSDGEDEDEDGVLPARTDVQILNVLRKIKNKDPSIYSAEAKFFDDGYNEQAKEVSSEDEHKEEKKKKPVYLKDVLANQLIEEGPDFQEDIPNRKLVVTYAEEQQALKDEFLKIATLPDSDGEEDSGLLKVRKKTADVLKEDDDSGGGPVSDVQHRAKDADITRRLEEYFGRDDSLDENEKFLKDYLLNKSWIDEDRDRIPSYDEIVGDVEEDEEELQKQDRFEAEYNFRFEEGVSSQVLGHSRSVEGSVRRKDDTRRQKRIHKKERLSEVALERREELKRLKNIKKREILEKLEKIRDVAGANASKLEILQREDLEEDFDPEEYDRKMKEAFGEEYYGAQDADENFQGHELDLLEKPEFGDEDELLGLRDEEGNFGFASAREKAKELQIAEAGAILDSKYEDSEDSAEKVDSAEGIAPRTDDLSKRKKKGKIALREKLTFDKQLEEYYKLDCEDMIGDLPTRFKYRQVNPNKYGLTASKILTADDKDLNQYVSLKKLAPYVAQEWKPKRRFHVSQKLRKKNALQQQPSKQAASHGNDGNFLTGNSPKDHQESSIAKDETQINGGGSEVSKSKKRRRKKGAPLSQSRLIAYGKSSVASKKRKRG